MIDRLGEVLTKSLTLEFHSILKKNSLDEERGFSECWKKTPNVIIDSAVQMGQYWEVNIRVDELLNW